jgi:hypothetical protein
MYAEKPDLHIAAGCCDMYVVTASATVICRTQKSIHLTDFVKLLHGAQNLGSVNRVHKNVTWAEKWKKIETSHENFLGG